MHNLLKAEIIKIKKIRSIKIFYLIYALIIISMGLLLTVIMHAILPDSVIASGLEASIHSLKDYTIFFVCSIILARIYISSEFDHNQINNMVSLGYPRWQIILSKYICYILLLIPVFLLYPIVMAVFSSMVSGWLPLVSIFPSVFELIRITCVAFLLYISIATINIFFVFLFKKPFLSAMSSLIFLFILSVLQTLLGNFFPQMIPVFLWFPNQLISLISMETLTSSFFLKGIISSIVFSSIFLMSTIAIFNKQDLH